MAGPNQQIAQPILLQNSGGYNFSVVVGNGTNNQNPTLWAQQASLFLATDFMEMQISVGLQFAYRSNDTNAGKERYAMIGGSDKESINYKNELEPPVMFTGKEPVVTTPSLQTLSITPATVEGNGYSFTNNVFTGTLDTPGVGYFGYIPGTKRIGFAPALPVTPNNNQNNFN